MVNTTTPGATPRYTVTVLRSLPELAAVRPLWQAWQQHPFADFDFYAMLCQARTPRPEPRVLVLHEHAPAAPHQTGQPVALLIGRLDRGPLPLRLGYTTLAAPSLPQLCFIAGGALGELTPQHMTHFAQAIDHLLRQERIALAIFEGVPPDGSLRQRLRSAFGRWRQAALSPAARHWRLDPLPATWPAFLATKTAKHRQALTRLPRTVERDHPGRWCIRSYTEADQATAFAEAAEAVAAGAYHRAMGVGFRRNAEYEARLQLEAATGRLRGYVLEVDGLPRAFWYCVVYQQTLHLLATAHHPDFKPYNPGTLLLMQAFQDHCGRDVRAVDFGPGDGDYKQRFGNACIDEGPVHVFAPTLRGHALRSLLGGLHALNQLGRWAVARAGLTQRLKTRWKRHLDASPSPARS